MSIVRMIVVDPRPRSGETDLRVYQVPGNSRELELLQEVFSQVGIECVVVDAPVSTRAGRGKRTKRREG